LITGLARQVAIALAPVFDRLADTITASGTSVGDLGERVRNTFRVIVASIGAVIGRFKAFQAEVISAAAAALEAQIGIQALLPGGATGQEEIGTLIQLRGQIRRLENDSNNAAMKWVTWFDSLHEGFEQTAKDATKAGDAVSDITSPFGGGNAGAGFLGMGIVGAVQQGLEAATMKAREAFGEAFGDRLASRSENAVVERGTVEAFRATRRTEDASKQTAANTGQLVTLGRSLLTAMQGGTQPQVVTF
jgi:hypothetical protein